MPDRTCRSCGAALTREPPIPRDAECPECGHDVRCCYNCRHYDLAYNNSCRETEADPVPDKHRRNFCEYFELSEAPAARTDSTREQGAREKLEGLFGGRPKDGPGAKPAGGVSREEAARRKLEDLFRKPDGD